MLVVHILAGALALVSGYVALYAAKGARLHRRSGTVFVWTMLTMAVFGLVVTLARDTGTAVNVPAAMLTCYLVVTGLTTVRPLAAGARRLDLAALTVVLAVVAACFVFGVEAIAAGGSRDGIPAFPFVLFGVVGLLAAAGDVRMLRAGGLRGALRIARHLWRMCFALFIAAMSFFLGQADEIPEPLRKPALLALPVLAVLVTMLYWLCRVRFRRSLRGLVGGTEDGWFEGLTADPPPGVQPPRRL
jgi:uncharacterized membrane protein